MASFTGKFESAKQNWTTPAWLFDLMDREFNFTFDLAADDDNHLCQNYYTEKDNSLIKDWSNKISWLNPPYGGSRDNSLKIWVKKAFDESRKTNTEVTLLIPARTNTNWWHEYCMKADIIIFLKGRPKFGDATHGLPQPLAILHFSNGKHGTKMWSLDVKKRKINKG